MEMKILYAALMALAGWIFFYICVRQLVFNFTVGYPLISKLKPTGESVFYAKAARHLNNISVIIWFFIVAGISFVVIRFAPLYLQVSFAVGFISCILLFIKKLGPKDKKNLEAFLRTYSRFALPDDLRTAMYNADVPKVHAALRASGFDIRFDK
ncbi:MAG: hypothetical protein GX684_01170 [Ruminococcaceae bacterium]|nr:hypothetical protein [Oscillospiraceae bacterium]